MESAKRRADEMGKIPNSIMEGRGNLTGFLGEEIAARVFNAKFANTYEYDLILEGGQTVDVKTKKTGVKPKGYYECSVSTVTRKQLCDYYAFVRVLKDYSMGYFLGWKKNKEYYKEAKEYKKGDIDPDNNHVFKASTFNLAIEDLEL